MDAASAATSVGPLALLKRQESENRVRCSPRERGTLVMSEFGTISLPTLRFLLQHGAQQSILL